MRSKKLLFGLFVSLFALMGSHAEAQTGGNKIVEIGPDNVGGRITSLVVDQRDETHNTLFAGAATGGLYVRSHSTDYAAYPDMWNYVPCTIDGGERVIPISDMLQLPNNQLVIATGEGCFANGDKLTHMAVKGLGILVYDPETNEFTRIKGSNPSNDSAFEHVNRIAYAYDANANTTYLYAATKSGAYRWAITNNNWNVNPTRIIDSIEMLDVAVVEEYGMVYFASANGLYRISDLNATAVVNVTNTNSVFANASRIQLATTPTNPDYLYAMVTDKDGVFSGLYLTSNQVSWHILTTETVDPFGGMAATTCGAICVDFHNSDHIFIGGGSMWVGTGYTPGAIFQWIKQSVNENEAGSTNFMDYVFFSPDYVHSGINSIVQTAVTDPETGEVNDHIFIGTNAGVFEYTEEEGYRNINKGLNNVQVNGVAVCTDGSLLIGAKSNANLFIQSRNDHSLNNAHVGSILEEATWYDPQGSGANHMANVYWNGNGGQVAASRFQQHSPLSRRNLFFSSGSGLYGRAYGDYTDYSNTQTWTIKEAFLGSQANRAYDVPQMQLWESENMSGVSTIVHAIDTNDEVIRPNRGAVRIGCKGSHDENSLNGLIRAGDTMFIPNVATASYPFTYVFTHNFTVENNGDTIRVDNPIQSHLFVLARNYSVTNGVANMKDKVAMTWMPADFTHVYSADDGSYHDNTMWWADIYAIDNGKSHSVNNRITTFAVSQDGDQVLAVVNKRGTDSCFIARVRGIFSKVDYHGRYRDIRNSLNYGDASVSGYTVVCDTLKYGESIWFPRMISSIVCASNDRAIITFQGHKNEADFADILLLTNSSSDLGYSFADKSISGKPAVYSALVECTTGDVFIGTEQGLYKTTSNSFRSANPSWSTYGNFNGVPITALTQQTNAQKLKRMTLNSGINVDEYVFPRTKFPYAIYIGTYGRGVFMDSSYVKDHTNEVLDETDYIGIRPVLSATGNNSISVFPNPATVRSTVEMSIAQSGNAMLRLYDLSGKVAKEESLGRLAEGSYTHTINCSGLPKGMYLVNLIVGKEVSSAKLIVR